MPAMNNLLFLFSEKANKAPEFIADQAVAHL